MWALLTEAMYKTEWGKGQRERGLSPSPQHLQPEGKLGGRKKEFWQPRIHAWLIKLARNKQNGNAKRMKPININRHLIWHL